MPIPPAYGELCHIIAWLRKRLLQFYAGIIVSTTQFYAGTSIGVAVRSIVRIPQQIEVAFFDWAAAKKVDKVRLMLSILLYGLFKLFL